MKTGIQGDPSSITIGTYLFATPGIYHLDGGDYFVGGMDVRSTLCGLMEGTNQCVEFGIVKTIQMMYEDWRMCKRCERVLNQAHKGEGSLQWLT